jgi:hypothetical protein
MVSERDIRIGRMPSIPDLSIPELIETNTPSAEILPATNPPPSVISPPTPPSSLPLATTTSKPPERRSPAMWIGPVALAVGAIVAAAIILGTKEEEQPPAYRPASGPSATTENRDKPDSSSNVVGAKTTASESGPVVPASSVIPSAAASPSAEASPWVAPVRSTVPVAVPKTSTKSPPVPPPIPTDPNF